MLSAFREAGGRLKQERGKVLETLWSQLKPLVPFGSTAAAAAILLLAANRLMAVKMKSPSGHQVVRQLVMALLTLAACIAMIVSLPISETLRGQVLGFLGIILSAAIALSSTTFLGNALAGILITSQRSFRGGDFIEVQGYFGRVSGRGLFHVEIQTQDRDLINIPNLFIATNPVKVIRATGTIISAQVSLGYDVPNQLVKDLLVQAAGTAGLEEPVVLVTELGDFSITYCVRGMLTETEKILTVRSNFKTAVIDHLHHGGVEIVSPTFMNTRQVQDRAFIPTEIKMASEAPDGPLLEEMAFDRAEIAGDLEKRMEQETQIREKIESLKNELNEEKDDARKEILRSRIDKLTSGVNGIQDKIVETQEKLEEEK